MHTPAHWRVDRIKWSISGLVGGTWGEEANGIDDLICVRVADFDRIRFRVVDAPPTLRAIEEKERSRRLLSPGDLLIEKSGGGDNQPVGCVVEFSHDFAAVCSNFIGRMPVALGMWPRYWAYVHASLYSGRLNIPAIKQTTGIQNLDTDAYFNQRVPFPPQYEQRAIADYLDRETARLDALVAAKERVLGLLAEKRRALITCVVTRGLEDNAPLKNTGMEWLPQIPQHWRSSRMGRLFKQVKRLGFAELMVLSVYREYGVIERASRDDNANRLPEDLDKYQLVEASDLVINKMKAWQGSLGVAGMRGITSPDYVVFQPLHREHPRFLHFLLRNQLLTTVYLSMSNGIRTNQWRLEPERFLDLAVPLPPLDEQFAIVARIDAETAKLEALRLATARTIVLLKERRAALIAAAVTGQIDIREGIA